MRFDFHILNENVRGLFLTCCKSLQHVDGYEVNINEVPEESPPSGSPSQPDGWLTISGSHDVARYVCQVKRRIDLQLLPMIIGRLREIAKENHAKPLLVTEYVNEPLAGRLKEQGIAYLDAAGNALLAEPGLYVWLRGFKPTEKRERITRAFQTTGLQLIALLLDQPDAVNWPYRKLAGAAGLSLGSTSCVMSDLRALGFIRLTGPDRNALFDRANLLEKWEFGYAGRLRPHLKPQSFKQPAGRALGELPQRIEAALREEVWVGGELAAALLTGRLRPQRATFHVHPHRPLLHIIKELSLIPDRSGNIVLIEQFGDADAWLHQKQGPILLAPTLLIHAELIHGEIDDRVHETAQIVLKEFMKQVSDDETHLKSERT